jgi:hypothetical protein
VALKDAMTVSSFLQLQDYTTFFTAANITTWCHGLIKSYKAQLVLGEVIFRYYEPGVFFVTPTWKSMKSQLHFIITL